MSDTNMKAATGQAGVSITLDNVVIEQFTGSTSYTDADGYDGNGGSIVISDKHVIKGYNALVDATDFADSGYTAGIWQKAAALSIDVGTCNILMAGNNGNKDAIVAAGADALINSLITAGDKEASATAIMAAGVTDHISEAYGLYEFASNSWNDMDVVGVVIGLPTLEITTTADEYDVGVAMAGAINDGDNFIHISKGASSMAIVSGVIEIAAH